MNINRKKSVIWKVPSEDFEDLIKNSNSIKEVLSHFGFTHYSNFKTIKERALYEGISLEHLYAIGRKKRITVLKDYNKRFIEIPLEKILVKNSTYNSTVSLKNRLLKEGLLEEKCYECGLGSIWNGKPLVLQLDHINGINNDNRIENLRLLCPNCHTQTETYAGKRKEMQYHCIKCYKSITKYSKSGLCKKCSQIARNENPETTCRKIMSHPTKKELEQMLIKEQIPFTTVGEKYDVSDTTIRKWCKKYGLPHTKKLIEEYIKAHYPHYCGICLKEKCEEHPTKEQLYNLFFNQNLTLSEVGKVIDKHPNTIKEYCKKLDLPSSAKEIEEYKNKHILVHS